MTVPARRPDGAAQRQPLDDALDRLEDILLVLPSEGSTQTTVMALPEEWHDARQAVATVREVLKRQREGQRLHSDEQARSADRLRAALERVEAAEAEVRQLREERDEARKQSREASEMYVQANEQITELLQQESFMERKLAAQREDIERLATRVEAAEAENRRLTEGLRDLESAVRVLDVMLREPAAKGLMSAEDYRTYLQGAWLGVDEAAEKARALLSASPSDGGGAK